VARNGIRTHQAGAFDLGLGHQESIERVAMVPRQVLDRFGMQTVDRQLHEVELAERREPAVCETQLSERSLDRDLPDAGSAQEHRFDIGERSDGAVRYRGSVARQQPDDYVRVEQQATH
jgi:hypothetical protein